MGKIGTAPGGTVSVTGLEQQNVRRGATVEVRRGSRTAARVTGTLVPAWVSVVPLPFKYKGRTLTVDCKSAPGWQSLKQEDFAVGFAHVGGYYPGKNSAPSFSCAVSSYADGVLTVSLEPSDSGKFERWLDSTLLVAVRG